MCVPAPGEEAVSVSNCSSGGCLRASVWPPPRERCVCAPPRQLKGARQEAACVRARARPLEEGLIHIAAAEVRSVRPRLVKGGCAALCRLVTLVTLVTLGGPSKIARALFRFFFPTGPVGGKDILLLLYLFLKGSKCHKRHSRKCAPPRQLKGLAKRLPVCARASPLEEGPIHIAAAEVRSMWPRLVKGGCAALCRLVPLVTLGGPAKNTSSPHPPTRSSSPHRNALRTALPLPL